MKEQQRLLRQQQEQLLLQQQQSQMYEQNRKLRQQMNNLQHAQGHPHPHVHVQGYQQPGMSRSNSQQSGVDSGRATLPPHDNDHMTQQQKMAQQLHPHPSLLPADMMLPQHMIQPSQRRQATEKKSLVIKSGQAEVQLDVTMDKVNKSVLQASVKPVPTWVGEPPTVTDGQDEDDSKDYETEEEVEIAPVVPSKDPAKYGLRIAQNHAEAKAMINRTIEGVTQDEVTTGMLASNASSIKRKKSLRVAAMSKSMNNPGYVSNPGGQFKQRRFNKTMENIDQINDMKEKLNDLASTFTEQLTIHEDQEKVYEPSQESVKSSSTPKKERSKRDMNPALSVPNVARSSHPTMPQRPPIEERNFHQQDFYNPSKAAVSRETIASWVRHGYSKSVVGLDRAHMNPNQKRLSVHQCDLQPIDDDVDRHFRAPHSGHRFSIRKQHRERLQSAKNNFVKPTGATNLNKAERRQRPITRTEPKPARNSQARELKHNRSIQHRTDSKGENQVQITVQNQGSANHIREEPSSQTRKKMGLGQKIFRSIFAKPASLTKTKGHSMQPQFLQSGQNASGGFNDPAILHAQPSKSRLRPQKSCNKLSLEDAPSLI